MAKQKKTTKQRRGARRTTGAIRVRTGRSAYSARVSDTRDVGVAADIDAAVRAGEALRSDIERRIEAVLVGY